MAAWPVSDLVGSDTVALPPRGTRGLDSGFGPWGRVLARLDQIPTQLADLFWLCDHFFSLTVVILLFHILQQTSKTALQHPPSKTSSACGQFTSAFYQEDIQIFRF